MNIASKNIIMKKQLPSAKGYVQDGLIAMWDSIENVGFGKHDPNATVWKDLVGDADAVPSSSEYPYYWKANSLACDETSNQYHGHFTTGIIKGFVDAVNLQGVTVENVNLRNAHWDLLTFDNGDRYQLRDLGGIWGIASMVETMFSIKRVNGVCCNSTRIVSGDVDSFESYCHGKYNAKYTATRKLSYRGRIYILGGTMRNDGAGDVGCVRVYNRLLTDAEIAANYEIDKARFELQ